MRYQLALLALFDRLARNRKDSRVGTHESLASWLDLDSVCNRSRRQCDPYLRCSLSSSSRRAHVDHRVRSALDRNRATIDYRRRRADTREYRPRIFRDSQVLRSAFPGEVKWWHTGHRRLRPAARLAKGSAESLDPAARAPRRLSNAAQRQKDRGAVRAARRLLDESR